MPSHTSQTRVRIPNSHIIHLLHRALALTGTSLILVLSISIAPTSHPPRVESSRAMAHRSMPVEEQSEQVRRTRIARRRYSATINGVLIIVDIVNTSLNAKSYLASFLLAGKNGPRTCKLHRCQPVQALDRERHLCKLGCLA
jgi:hypothetical protein